MKQSEKVKKVVDLQKMNKIPINRKMEIPPSFKKKLIKLKPGDKEVQIKITNSLGNCKLINKNSIN